MDEYYSNVKILMCQCDKCRIHAHHGTGFHCESCYEDLDDVDKIPVTLEKIQGSPKIVNCYGFKCRENGSDGIFANLVSAIMKNIKTTQTIKNKYIATNV